MKTSNALPRLAMIAVTIVALLLGTGCASRVGDGEITILQNVLNSVLEDDFEGDTTFEHTNAYLTITFAGGGLKKTNGRWRWDWVRYDRRSHFPFWQSTGKVYLGNPPMVVR